MNNKWRRRWLDRDLSMMNYHHPSSFDQQTINHQSLIKWEALEFVQKLCFPTPNYQNGRMESSSSSSTCINPKSSASVSDNHNHHNDQVACTKGSQSLQICSTISGVDKIEMVPGSIRRPQPHPTYLNAFLLHWWHLPGWQQPACIWNLSTTQHILLQIIIIIWEDSRRAHEGMHLLGVSKPDSQQIMQTNFYHQ